MPSGRPPAGQPALHPVGRPAHDRAFGLPRHDFVDPEFGEHLHRQLGTVALRQCLDGDVAHRTLRLVQHLADRDHALNAERLPRIALLWAERFRFERIPCPPSQKKQPPVLIC